MIEPIFVYFSCVCVYVCVYFLAIARWMDGGGVGGFERLACNEPARKRGRKKNNTEKKESPPLALL